MTKSASNSEQTVEALLAERQRYEAWLSTLEERRESTPSHIYDRVHADYAARLQRVVEQLDSQRTALQQLEHSIMDRLRSLDVEEARHRDEAAEAELRASVGELTPEEHDEVIQRTQAGLTRIAEARESAVPELTRIRAVLERGAEKRPSDGEDASDEAAQERPEPAETRAAPGGFDELNFLKSLVESPVKAGDGGAKTSRSSTTDERGDGARGSGRETDRDEKPARESLREEPREDAADVPQAARPPRKGPGLDVQHEESSLLKGVRGDQVKTLKCQECGTENYPTEWYCERCGAELAAL